MSNFAAVNTLERHIEVLLLTNDCVIVPSLGGFVAHHVCARYVEEEGLFLPPLRTIGFNPQLTMNDSLLAQSYAEAEDISLPEALDHIEAEVAALRRQLDEVGEVEMTELGRLFKNAEGHLAFSPCDGGILTPSLYALSSFEMRALVRQQDAVAQEVALQPSAAEPVAAPEASAHRAVYVARDVQSGQQTLHISLRALRNVAAVAAVVAVLFMVAFPLSQQGGRLVESVKSGVLANLLPSDEQLAETISSSVDAVRHKTAVKTPAKPGVKTPKVEAKPTAKPSTPAVPSEANPTMPAVEKSTTPVVAKPSTPAPAVAKPAGSEAAQAHYWSLVLCSHVSQAGAEMFVGQLAKEGVSGAVVSRQGGATKVLYGHYASAAEAQAALNSLNANTHFQRAWVLEVK